MKILIGYSYYSNPVDVSVTVNNWINRLKLAGLEVDGFPLTINPPGPPYWWKQLDICWKLGDKKLLGMYEKLALEVENYDVFLNLNGINLHPDFVATLPTVNVYACFDDPESSERLSKPVASAYDLCLVGNIAEIATYKSWGVKKAEFWPLGFMSTDYDPNLTEEQILYGEREQDITLLCEKKYFPDRIKRLDYFSSHFPNGKYYGPGWNNGFLAEQDRIPLYLRTKIGPNFHNSTGPINLRTYSLPACGVMQVCDNKSYLGKIFELDKEVVGFDTVEESVEKVRYYLTHDEERRKIAAAGWKRSLRDYNEVSVFGLVEKYSEDLVKSKVKSKISPHSKLINQRIFSIPNKISYIIRNKISPERHL
jgi:spore maturation protein CgeB